MRIVVCESRLRLSEASRAAQGVIFRDGRVARAPRLAVAKDVGEPDLHLPWPGQTDCIGTFNADDFNLPTTIARIIVIQHLSRLEHELPAPEWAASLSNRPNSKLLISLIGFTLNWSPSKMRG